MITDGRFEIERATADGQDYVHFLIDQGYSRGILHFSHEMTITYDMNSGEWKGGEICSDGWVNFDKDEVAEIVKKFDLDNELKKFLNNNQ